MPVFIHNISKPISTDISKPRPRTGPLYRIHNDETSPHYTDGTLLRVIDVTMDELIPELSKTVKFLETELSPDGVSSVIVNIIPSLIYKYPSLR